MCVSLIGIYLHFFQLFALMCVLIYASPASIPLGKRVIEVRNKYILCFTSSYCLVTTDMIIIQA